MAGAILPVVKGIYVCDDVVGNPDGGKPMVVNLWDTVRAPAGLPHTLPKLCVFAWLRGGRGRVTFRIDVVRASTNVQIRDSVLFEHEFTNPNLSLWGRFMLSDVTFYAGDRYLVELYCNDEFVDDQVINVTE